MSTIPDKLKGDAMVLVLPRKKSEYAPGANPASLENLQPRETLYDQPKKRREVMATDTGWQGFKSVAKEMGLSASELVERVGRGAISVHQNEREEAYQYGLTVLADAVKCVDNARWKGVKELAATLKTLIGVIPADHLLMVLNTAIWASAKNDCSPIETIYGEIENCAWSDFKQSWDEFLRDVLLVPDVEELNHFRAGIAILIAEQQS